MCENKPINIILSTTILLEEGIFKVEKIDLKEAKDFALMAENFVTDSTVRLLGIEPTTERKVYTTFDNALVIKAKGRIDFGKEYTKEGIEGIGYELYLIKNISLAMELLLMANEITKTLCKV